MAQLAGVLFGSFQTFAQNLIFGPGDLPFKWIGLLIQHAFLSSGLHAVAVLRVREEASGVSKKGGRMPSHCRKLHGGSSKAAFLGAH